MSKFNHTIEYVMKYGGRCRDCADENGTCPHDGTPCDPQVMRSAIKHTLEALEYVVSNGFIESPFPHPTPARCDELNTEKWEAFIVGDWLQISGEHAAWKHSKVRELVTRQNAEEVIAAERMKLEATARVGLQLSEKIDALEADNKRLREALERIADWPNGGKDYGQENIKRFARAALGEVKP